MPADSVKETSGVSLKIGPVLICNTLNENDLIATLSDPPHLQYHYLYQILSLTGFKVLLLFLDDTVRFNPCLLCLVPAKILRLIVGPISPSNQGSLISSQSIVAGWPRSIYGGRRRLGRRRLSRCVLDDPRTPQQPPFSQPSFT